MCLAIDIPVNGSIIKGRAINGCSDNIVIRLPKRKFKFADGKQTNREEILKKCFTNEAGKGKTRERLDEAINIALNFIDKHNN